VVKLADVIGVIVDLSLNVQIERRAAFGASRSNAMLYVLFRINFGKNLTRSRSDVLSMYGVGTQNANINVLCWFKTAKLVNKFPGRIGYEFGGVYRARVVHT
jgi:hypothetical protein